MSGESGVAPKLHDAVKPLAWLIGRWRSTRADGIFPTIKDFKYTEELEFTSIGQPNIQFTFYSYNAETGAPMHREVGFIRVKPGTNHIAFISAHNMGLTDMAEGELTGTELLVQSTSTGRMSFGSSPAVKQMRRRFKLNGEELEQVLDMETDRTPLTEHLRATYQKL